MARYHIYVILLIMIVFSSSVLASEDISSIVRVLENWKNSPGVTISELLQSINVWKDNKVCPLPWGGTLSNGESVTAYVGVSPVCGQGCLSEARVCKNGFLSGTFNYSECRPQACNAAEQPVAFNLILPSSGEALLASYWKNADLAGTKTSGTTRKVEVSTLADLKNAVSGLAAGDMVLLKDGSWDDLVLEINAPTGSTPIIFRPTTIGKAILNRPKISISGKNVVFTGFEVVPSDSTAFRLKTSKGSCINCRITNNYFHNAISTTAATSYWIEMYGSYNRVDHNVFEGHANQGSVINIKRVEKVSENHRIDRNVFGPRIRLGRNGGDMITIGGGSQNIGTNSGTWVESNYFIGANGESEIISVKAGGSYIARNVFLNSNGFISLRQGDGSYVVGNYFVGSSDADSGGIRFTGTKHYIIDNYIQDVENGIIVHEGSDYINPKTGYLDYVAASNALIQGNVIINNRQSIVLGGKVTDAETNATTAPSAISMNQNLLMSERGQLLYIDTNGGSYKSNGFSYSNNILSGSNHGISGFTNQNLKLQKDTCQLWSDQSVRGKFPLYNAQPLDASNVGLTGTWSWQRPSSLCPITCTNECTSGTKQCSGNGYQACGNYDTDSCTEWSTVTACPTGQTCSNGACGCTNECTYDATQCSGIGLQTCGNYDADTCTEWGPVASCPIGQTCSNSKCSCPTAGSCVNSAGKCYFHDTGSMHLWCDSGSWKACNESGVGAIAGTRECSRVTSNDVIDYQWILCMNECTSGTKQCIGNGNQTCGNYDADSCTEWSVIVVCPTGQTCSNGACGCTNECASGATQCSGTGYQTCGNYDADTCTEWGSVASCPTGQACSNSKCACTPASSCINSAGKCYSSDSGSIHLWCDSGSWQTCNAANVGQKAGTRTCTKTSVNGAIDYQWKI